MPLYIDTHTHLFSSEFDIDREKVIEFSQINNVRKFIIPNIDSSTIEPMLRITDQYTGICFAAIGLHPTSVNSDFEKELSIIEQWLEKKTFYAIGETGIDLYWDKTFLEEQKEAFKRQLILSSENNLPVIIHSRDSLEIIINILEEININNLSGVFHCFPGNKKQAFKVIEMGFVLGIGGVVTYKNSGLAEIIKDIAIEKIVLETDSPYLSPVPKRGSRNDSSNIIYIAQKIAEIKNIDVDDLAAITSNTAMSIFNI